MALSEFEAFDSEAGAKRNVKAAIEKVAARLGNTPTICRQCYIHPEVVNAYLEGSVLAALKQEAKSELRKKLGKLTPEEAAVLSLLQSRAQARGGGETEKRAALIEQSGARRVPMRPASLARAASSGVLTLKKGSTVSPFGNAMSSKWTKWGACRPA